MNHKKTQHPEVMPSCNDLRSKKIKRNKNNCWFEHKEEEPCQNSPGNNSESHKPDSGSKPSEQQVFQEVLGNSPPPDQIKTVLSMMTKMFSKMEDMELRIQSLTK